MNLSIKLISVFTTYLFFPVLLHAQCETYIDDLNKRISATEKISEKLLLLQQKYLLELRADSATKISTLLMGIQISTKNNDATNESIFSSHLARYYGYVIEKPNKSLYTIYITRAFQKANNNKSKGMAWFSKGATMSQELGMGDSTLICYLKALDYLKNTDSYYYIVTLYQNLAAYYSYQLLYSKQLYYAKEGVRYAKEVIRYADPLSPADEYTRMKAFFTLAVAYNHYYLQDKAMYRSYLDSSIRVYNLIISRRNSLVCGYDLVIDSYYNLSTIYALNQPEYPMDSAISYLDKVALYFDEEYPGFSLSNTRKLFQLFKAKILLEQDKLPEAIKAVQASHNYYTQIMNDPYTAEKYYWINGQIAEKKGNYKEAYRFKQLELEMKDSMYNLEKLSTVQKTETQFKNYKQEQELIQSKSENIFRKKLSYFYLSIIVLAIAGLACMLRAYNLRKKNFANTKALLEKDALNAIMEKELIENEMLIATQEKLLTEQQKNRLQDELMYNKLQIERKNDLIRQLQEGLFNIKTTGSTAIGEVNKMGKVMERSIETDEELDFIQNSFANTNPKFFNLLQEKGRNTLTLLDFKYCAYIKMGMSNREIAKIMNIESASMRMAKYRIKQKLSLSKEDDLESYLMKL